MDTHLGSLCKRGHSHKGTGKSLRTAYNECVECRRLASNRYFQRHRERDKPKDNENKYLWRRASANNQFRYLCIAVKARCKQKGIPFDLDATYLEGLWAGQEGLCYWLKVKMELNLDLGAQHPSKATLDRLVPELGYTKGNVVWASSFVNRGRVNLPVEEFRAFLAQVREAMQ